MKVKITIANTQRTFDDAVFVETELPFIPRKGDLLYLTKEQHEFFEKMIDNRRETYSNCVYGSRDPYVSIDDFIWVSQVGIEVETQDVWVELDDK